MRLTLTLIASLILAGNVCAEEWVLLSDGKDAKLYIQKINKVDDGVYSVWLLYDHKERVNVNRNRNQSPVYIKSSVYKVRYYCRSETKTDLIMQLFSENMGKGDLVFENKSSSETEDVFPNTNHDKVMTLVCNESSEGLSKIFSFLRK